MEHTPDKKTIKDLIDLKKSGVLTPNSEYQRGPVWDKKQQKKLIDSVLRGYPLPMFYLHYKKTITAGLTNEQLEIIDGQQRINALAEFAERELKLFDPIKDDKVARFPSDIKNSPCPWGHKTFDELDDTLKEKFLNTELSVVKITTDCNEEARDLFIRLQSGLPLTSQEKRDAWPGGYTEFVLKYGGKESHDDRRSGYVGHDFFRHIVKHNKKDRGGVRTLCAQIGMLFFRRATQDNWLEIGTQNIDDYYYQNLGFDNNSPEVKRFKDVLNKVCTLLQDGKRKPLLGHEAIHLVLLTDSLMDEYTKSWEANFARAFDTFREMAAIEKKNKKATKETGEFWDNYIMWTRTSSNNADVIRLRHNYFTNKMFEILKPQSKDPQRLYGQIEKEIIYYRDKKTCADCKTEIKWDELEIHHVDEYQNGGQTILGNGVPVHKVCHPKGQKAVEFAKKWKLEK